MSRPARHAGGFTLLEVMVAMAILAMSLTAAFEVVGGALQNHLRTRELELATMLARAKLVEVEAKFEEDGFRDFDQSEDGTFEDEGHPEIRWKVATVKPTLELGAEGVVKAFTGAEGGLESLLAQMGGAAPASQGSGSSSSGPQAAASPLAAATTAMLQSALPVLGEQIKKGVRQLRLTVSWQDGSREESFTVVTHLVVLTPGAGATTTPGGLPGGLGGGGGLPPGFPPAVPPFTPPGGGK